MVEYSLIEADCLEAMRTLGPGSVDAIICDPPYGTTACKWDAVIPFEPMWAEVWRVLKPNGVALFTASQPFTSALVMSQPKAFKYEWIWEKAVGSNFALMKYQPMKEHESVLVFSRKVHAYYPIMQARKGTGAKSVGFDRKGTQTGEATGSIKWQGHTKDRYSAKVRNPSSVQFFNNRAAGDRGDHPTQKPVALLSYLIRTYTRYGETVLDFTMGSGSTGVAAMWTGRDFIGIENDMDYFTVADGRIGAAWIEQDAESIL